MGTQALAAVGSTSAFVNLINGFFIGLRTGATVILSQFFGANDHHGVRNALHTGVMLSVLLGRHFILGIYTTDAEVVRVGAYVMLWIVPFNLVFMPVEVFAGAMRGTGYSTVPTVITGTCACAFRIFWVLVIVSRWHTVEMLALAYPISWVLSAVVFYIAYLRGNWLSKRIEVCGMMPEVKS